MISLTHALDLLLHYRYALLFPIAVVEGPIVSILGGFLAASHYLNIYLVYLVVVAGDLVGDTFYYSLGRFGGRGIIDKYGKYLRINPQQLAKLETHFREHAGKTLFFGKFSHGLGSVVLFIAGIGRTRYPRFFVINLLSTMLKSLVLVIIGYYFGYAYQQIDVYLNNMAYVVIAMVIVVGLIYYAIHHTAKRML